MIGFIFVLKRLNIFLFSLSGLFSAFSVTFELFFSTNGAFAFFELGKIDVIVLLLDVVLFVHQFCHFVTIEYFFFLFSLRARRPLFELLHV